MQREEGIVPARVTAHKDPKRMGRLQVQFFWQADGATHWARLVTPHAGPDRGMMFLPEVGDEVAVVFEDGDPERPVVVGSVWNGAHPAPRADLRGEDIAANDVKRLVTKSGNRLQLSDKPGVETVLLATPHHSRIQLTEKADSTGRSEITLETDLGDIVLHAPQGRVHVESLYYSEEIGAEVPDTNVGSAPLQKSLSGALISPAPPGGLAKASCDYLKNAELRVIPGSQAFDAQRRPYLLGTSSKLNYAFRGHSEVPAIMQTVNIGGHPVKVIRAVADPTDPSTKLPSNDQIASSLSAIPPSQLSMIHRVILSPDRDPDDTSYAAQFGISNFHAEATSGIDGNVHFYPVPKTTPMALDETLVHETGHTFSKNVYGDDASTWKEWPKAMAADQRPPSQYGAKNRDEDFAESMVMYTASKGTPCEAAARLLYPHRYALLDHLTSETQAAKPAPSASPSFLDWLRGLF